MTDKASRVLQHPEDKCQECGRSNDVWFVASEFWNKAVPAITPILCPTCFIKRADAAGIVCTGWELVPENLHAGVPAEAQPPDLLYEAAAEIINHVYHYPTTVDGLRKILSRHFGEAEHAPRSQETKWATKETAGVDAVGGGLDMNVFCGLHRELAEKGEIASCPVCDRNELREHVPRSQQCVNCQQEIAWQKRMPGENTCSQGYWFSDATGSGCPKSEFGHERIRAELRDHSFEGSR